MAVSMSDWLEKTRKRYEELYPHARAEKPEDGPEEPKTEDERPLHEVLKALNT
jgi:hypothetical protein